MKIIKILIYIILIYANGIRSLVADDFNNWLISFKIQEDLLLRFY